MSRLHPIVLAVVVSLLIGAGKAAVAEDIFYVKPLRELEFTKGALPENFDQDRVLRSGSSFRPYAALETEGEAYVVVELQNAVDFDLGDSEFDSTSRIAMRVPQRREIRGKLFIPRADQSGADQLGFVIPAKEGKPGLKPHFLRAKRAHYERLLDANIVGAAWFRHESRAAAEALGEKWDEQRDRRRRFFGRSQSTDLESTYALASGGRAVSENLQLDRMLPESERGEATVPVDSIKGITVQEFDWEELTENIDPERDPLAAFVPDDQHALFFPSFSALVRVADTAQEQGTPVLRAAEARAEDALSRERYQRQLCLPLGQAERWLGPQLIKSVAITGGDPYFRTGTDVAVLFEAKNPQLLRQTIDARVALSLKDHPDAKAMEGEINGVAYAGARSTDRTICCYVASLDDVVIVANSPRQLERIVAVRHGNAPALDALPEYAFFRDRYPRSDAEESALLVISDKTIRRWCGPRWRIAASRRTRAAAVMAEVQAAHLERLVEGDVERSQVEAVFWVPEADRFTLTPEGVRSSVYGDLDYQTPISELELAYVTTSEADLYRRWRVGYERNWSNFFDPIAVRFTASPDKLAVDLTVMPLIDNSDYEEWASMSRGAKLQPDDGDPHPEALIHWALALNPDSERMKQYGNFAQGMIRVNPLSWIGESAGVYADRDPFFRDWAAAEDRDDFAEENLHRLPVALHISSRSTLKLTAFLTALRGFIEQTAPGMTVWETRTHNGEPYVEISPSERAQGDLGDEFDRLAIYYAASGQGLTVTLNESVLQRALDRQKARREANDEAGVKNQAAPWLGENLCLRVERDVLAIIQAGWGDDYRRVMQARAWGNLPILNEWRRLFPEHDPFALHERFWGARPVCPGGGKYVWNESWQTYESTVYGHPGEPKAGPGLPRSLEDVSQADFGLTFEENGLRGRVELSRRGSE
ncbi:MAG: hypothetical protein KY475_16780 [Planctomycetes bacterium]|nr:hypothetical protein [Planctomycetota bacterium]